MSLGNRIDDSIRGASQRNHTQLLNAINEVTQKHIAASLGITESVMSEWKNNHLERIAALIAACGLSLHPATHHLYDESYIGALKTLASVGLGRQGGNRGDE